MNIYISADMEGLTGVTVFKEIKENEPDYPRFRKIMTAEVNAAITGALKVTSGRVLVNDSHANMRNLFLEDLHSSAELISGSVKNYSMMEGLDENFDAVFCIGYHAMSGTLGAVRAHTFSDEVYYVKVNGVEVGELGMNAYYAGELGVPVVLVSGDDKVAEEAYSLLGEVQTAVVKKGISVGSAIQKPLIETRKIIENQAQQAMEDIEKFEPLKTIQDGTITVAFKHLEAAERVGRLPFVRRLDGYTIELNFEGYQKGFENLISVLKVA